MSRAKSKGQGKSPTKLKRPDRKKVSMPPRSSARTYPYCVRKSRVPSAGMGVFTQEDVSKNTTVGLYKGCEYTLQEWEDNKDDVQKSDYVMTVENNRGTPLYYVDARDKIGSNFTRYINCARNRRELNCEIHHIFDRKQQRWVPTIRATKSIQRGSELFLNYGEEYCKVLFGKNPL